MLNISKKLAAPEVGIVMDVTAYSSTAVAEAVSFSIRFSYSMVSLRNFLSASRCRTSSLPVRDLSLGSGGSKTGAAPGLSIFEGSGCG